IPYSPVPPRPTPFPAQTGSSNKTPHTPPTTKSNTAEHCETTPTQTVRCSLPQTPPQSAASTQSAAKEILFSAIPANYRLLIRVSTRAEMSGEPAPAQYSAARESPPNQAAFASAIPPAAACRAAKSSYPANDAANDSPSNPNRAPAIYRAIQSGAAAANFPNLASSAPTRPISTRAIPPAFQSTPLNADESLPPQ